MYIYKITNIINNYFYIGKTTKTIEERFISHINEAYNESGRSYENYLKRAIRKYGKENFKIELIDTAKTKKELSDKEKYWIKKTNAYCGWKNSIGYNLTLGGDGGRQPIAIYRINILTGDIEEEFFSIIEAEKIYNSSITNVINKINKPLKCMGKCFIKKNLYDSMNKKELLDFLWNRYNIVFQLDINGNIVNKYESLKDASNKTNISETNINNSINKHVIAGGYQWTYYKNLNNILHKKYKTKTSLSVEQYDLDDNYITTYNSLEEAAKAINQVDGSCIAKVCKGKRKQTGGYKWKYTKESIELNRKNKVYIQPVIQYDLNMNELNKFNSLEEAAKYINGSSCCIRQCINGNQNTAYGYKWGKDEL